MQSRFMEMIDDEITPVKSAASAVDEITSTAPKGRNELEAKVVLAGGAEHDSTKQIGPNSSRRISKRCAWFTKRKTQDNRINRDAFDDSQLVQNTGATKIPPVQRILVDPAMLTCAEDVRVRRFRKAANIAKVLLHVLMDEIEVHGLLQDYVGYPYRSGLRASAWDRPNESTPGEFIMGVHQELFPDAIALLRRDLLQRGFSVLNLSFREEKITFPTSAAGDFKVKRGIGLGWHLA